MTDTGPGVVVGARVGPFEGCVDRDLVRRYAAATADPSPGVRAGEAVPAVAIATQIWDAQNAARAAAVPAWLQQEASGGVHGEHDIVLHRPIVPGEPLRTWVEAHGARPAGRNALVTLRYVTLDAAGATLAEQWWTTVYLGVTCAATGEPPRRRTPSPRRPGPARWARATWPSTRAWPAATPRCPATGRPTTSRSRRPGAAAFDRPFLHGLCTMALCARGVVEQRRGRRPRSGPAPRRPLRHPGAAGRDAAAPPLRRRGPAPTASRPTAPAPPSSPTAAPSCADRRRPGRGDPCEGRERLYRSSGKADTLLGSC